MTSNTYTLRKKGALYLFIDPQNWKYIDRCPELFNLGDNIRRCIRVTYHNFGICKTSNRFTCKYSYVLNRVRQRPMLSSIPLILSFLIVIQIFNLFQKCTNRHRYDRVHHFKPLWSQVVRGQHTITMYTHV